MSSLWLANLGLPKISLELSIFNDSLYDGTLWKNLQLAPSQQHPLQKWMQKKLEYFSNKSAFVYLIFYIIEIYPVSISGLFRVSAASLSFTVFFTSVKNLSYHMLYSSSPYL